MGSKFNELVRARIARTNEGWEMAVRQALGATVHQQTRVVDVELGEGDVCGRLAAAGS